jgi:hypothetical protein
MIEAAKDNRYGHRDATMLLVASRHGLRASEICDGSSDCAKCRSHLLQWSNGKALPLLDANVPARREGVRYAWLSAGHRTRAVEDW